MIALILFLAGIVLWVVGFRVFSVACFVFAVCTLL